MPSITVELTEEQFQELRQAAPAYGEPEQVLRRFTGEELGNFLSRIRAQAAPVEISEAARLMRLPRAEREAEMRRQAEEMAPYYRADMDLPEEERELTAFMTLNDPVREPDEYLADWQEPAP